MFDNGLWETGNDFDVFLYNCIYDQNFVQNLNNKIPTWHFTKKIFELANLYQCYF